MAAYNDSSGGGDLVKVSLIAFNLTVMVYGLYRMFTHRGIWTFAQGFGAAGIAIVLGLVVGGVTYAVASKMGR